MSMPYPPPGPQWQRPVPTVNETKATLSLVMGILSLFCFGAFTGVPAIVLGLMSRRDIARSGGALGGGGMAIAGMVSGGLGVLTTFVWVATFVAGIFAAHSATSGLPTGYPPPTVYVTPTASAPASGSASSSGALESAETESTRVGKVVVLDVHAGSGPLRAQLVAARQAAVARGATLIVQTTTTECDPCRELASSLVDPRMQSALKDAALARVDVNELGEELESLSMNLRGQPAFYKIDSRAQPTDAITGDEWDENVPKNMAPVLDAFVHGKLKTRRHPAAVGTAL